MLAINPCQSVPCVRSYSDAGDSQLSIQPWVARGLLAALEAEYPSPVHIPTAAVAASRPSLAEKADHATAAPFNQPNPQSSQPGRARRQRGRRPSDHRAVTESGRFVIEELGVLV